MTTARTLGRVAGVALVATAAGAALLGTSTAGRLAAVMEELETSEPLPQFVAALLSQPWLVALLALPALACGVLLLVLRRGGLVVLTLGVLAALLPVGAVLYALISVLAPWYTVQPW